MSHVDQFHAEPPPPPPPGMSTGSRILMGCGLGCGVLMLLCCGSIAGLGWLGYRTFSRALTREPAEIQALADEIAKIDVPPGLKPEAGFDVKLPIVDRTFVRFVVYSDEKHDQVLGIGEFAEAFTAVDENRIRDEIDRALNESDHRDHDDDFRITETHPVELQIRDNPAHFRIEEGVDKHDHKQVRAFGEFEGRHGVGLLFLQLDGENYSVEKVEELLHSIQ